MKIVFLDDLPKKHHAGRICIDWVNTIGYGIYFIYNNIKGIIYIEDYCKKDKKLKIKYNNNYYYINTISLCKCMLGKITGEFTNNFKISIGENICNEKVDFVIIDRKYKKNNNNQNIKYYKCRCLKCGYITWKDENNILIKNNGCKGCISDELSKPIITKNDIPTLYPNLIKYFINKNDIYKYAINSHKKTMLICPCCGYKKEMVISNFIRNGFSCPRCGDGFKYTEKFMFNFLEQLGIEFIYQYSKTNAKWCKNYRYDFYFKLNNEEYIIETHGLQHYEENTNFKMSLKEIRHNDKNKYELATNNGIKPENYIVIDCRYSNLKYIKNNILNSRFNELFDLTNIDWIKIGQECEKSLVKEVCDYWNKFEYKYTAKDLEKTFKISRKTVVLYLKKGSLLGWLNNCYDGKRELLKGIELKETGENNKNYNDIYMYNYETKELIVKGKFQKDIAKWLYENGYSNSLDTAKKHISYIIKQKNGIHTFNKNKLKIIITYNKIL